MFTHVGMVQLGDSDLSINVAQLGNSFDILTLELRAHLLHTNPRKSANKKRKIAKNAASPHLC